MRRRPQGFTLFEVMVAVAILGVAGIVKKAFILTDDTFGPRLFVLLLLFVFNRDLRIYP